MTKCRHDENGTLDAFYDGFKQIANRDPVCGEDFDTCCVTLESVEDCYIARSMGRDRARLILATEAEAAVRP